MLRWQQEQQNHVDGQRPEDLSIAGFSYDDALSSDIRVIVLTVVLATVGLVLVGLTVVARRLGIPRMQSRRGRLSVQAKMDVRLGGPHAQQSERGEPQDERLV